MFTYTRDLLTDLPAASRCEWVLGNGLGGYASSTLIGLSTRRYHGLLVASAVPLVDRRLLVAKLSEGIVFGKRRYELDCNQYPDVVYPEGHLHLVEATAGGCVVSQTWSTPEGELKREIAVAQGRNATAVVYTWRGTGPGNLELRPLTACRSYHHTQRCTPHFNGRLAIDGRRVRLQPYEDGLEIHMAFDSGEAFAAEAWYYNLRYERERERGLDFEEDLFCPGIISIPLVAGRPIGLVLSTEEASGEEAHDILASERRREQAVIASSPLGGDDPRVNALLVAADSMIATRPDDRATIIAGYHWFTDWGRDAMIALPGLAVSQGRLDIAKSVILTFARSMSRGLIPNRFTDAGEEPDYNTVDATLWMFVAAKRLAETLEDPKPFIAAVWPALAESIDWHRRGTRYGIHMDPEDGLLWQGEGAHQLTWMDAKVGDWVITPRFGKPVEIAGLWCNALLIAAEFGDVLGERAHADDFRAAARLAMDSFDKAFWLEEKGYFADVVTADGPDESLRPNQMIAVSLPHPVADAEHVARAVDAVRTQLLTPYGLRTLAPGSYGYRGVYEGDVFGRDSAYHQGTAWGWLIGPYCRALLRVRGDAPEAREEVRALLEPLLEHVRDTGVGSLSEVFSGDPPHTPGGCVSQAWSVAEVLDVLTLIR